MSETAMTTERRGEELPERWSAQRKTEIVLRVIRGEAIDEVAREIQVRRTLTMSGRTRGARRHVTRVRSAGATRSR